MSEIEATRPRAGEPCPVCDCEEILPRFAVEGTPSQIVACTRCGHARLDPMPSAEEIAGFYPREYYGEPGTKFRPLIERLVRFIGARHIRFLCRGLASGARVLDVGCGRGVILGPLADRGYSVFGVEVSEDAVRGADRRAEIRVAPTLREAGFEAASFDQIVIWHVLEHLRDPRATLEECHRILEPSGRLIVAVPNFSSWQARWAGAGWFHLDAPRHLHQFPLSSLRQLMERCGFDCGPAYHFSLRQNPFGWIQSALNKLDPERPNRLYTALQPSDAGASPRLAAWAWLVLGAIPALVLSVAAALFRSGATVHIVATRRNA